MSTSNEQTVGGLVELVAHLLPAQGPIGIFIHHNTLHAFEDRRFEDAVVEAGRLFGCEPFLSEEAYRQELAEGRISEVELRDVISSELGPGAGEPIGGLVPRSELAYALARYGIPEARGAALRWMLEELDALEQFRADVPLLARGAFASIRGAEDGGEGEAAWLRQLWVECLGAVDRGGPCAAPARRRSQRHRDLLLGARAIDLDESIHPVLVRFVAAYLDQGLALWPMGNREQGMFASFIACYRHGFARWCAPWGSELTKLLEREATLARSASDSLLESLDALGVQRDERFRFLLDTALALRGWAGMVRQVEERPDRVPVRPVPARLVDFLAIRLLLERAALTQAAGTVPLERLRERLRAETPPPPTPARDERAWQLFQAAQLLGLEPLRIRLLSTGEVMAFEGALVELGPTFRRKVLHLAFELQLRRRFFDALVLHRETTPVTPPSMQVITCLDEREESLRRHLEEVDSSVETFGTAGFFAVPMYFKAERDARARPLAPVAIRPAHYVELETAPASSLRTWRERLAQLRGQAVHVGSRGLFRGALVSVLGGLSLVPLILRVLFPRHRRMVPGLARAGATGSLALRRSEVPPPLGEHRGFTPAEMAGVVERMLGDVGLRGARFAPLVVVLGHASDSLNNPHRSAYDCGACGGGPGGPNARACAAMANDPEVRALLRGRGCAIPDGTWFLAGEHNTTDDSIELFDGERVPDALRPALARARTLSDEARARNAQERCRRFANLPTLSPQAALRHVQGRREDLAEPRPEYNHATNAVCLIGRRFRTRGLFLDRRAFLVSYDPTADDAAATVLARTLAAVVPVVAGINLEYFFGTVDNEGYGAGTKLPHNVSALVGVMNGAQSDLRTGLWAQTVEIHEAVRLTLVVEAGLERLQQVVAQNPYLEQLVARRWIFLAALDPSGSSLWELGGPAPRLHSPGPAPPEVAPPSVNWYRGKRGHLPFAELRSGKQP